jgi:hypothetical protein
MRLRDYRSDDFESMWSLDQECFPPGISYSRSDLRAFLSRVQLEVAATNTNAITFYEHLGYRKVAHLTGYYGRRLHAWKMKKVLDGSPLAPAP